MEYLKQREYICPFGDTLNILTRLPERTGRARIWFIGLVYVSHTGAQALLGVVN